MTLAIDSSALLSVFKGEPTAETWVEVFNRQRRHGRLIVCDVVVAEVAAKFPEDAAYRRAMDALGIEFVPVELPAALLAGRIFAEYRREGGPRVHLAPDFLIGAHAATQADALAAVDRGYLRQYFSELKVLAV